MSVYKLNNVIQTYSWGSIRSLHEMFNVENPDHKPQAEMWMGAHPGGCSRVLDQDISLTALLSGNSTTMLGSYTALRYGELPYLLKVIAADSPLSIQVHPNKQQAEAGFQRENELGIPINANHRNYKDSNHKPELVYALTFFSALNGFRPIDEIIHLFEEANIQPLRPLLQMLRDQPNEASLGSLFTKILTLAGDDKQSALSELILAVEMPPKSRLAKEAWQTIKILMTHYQGDVGLFAPLLLNIVELAPGEAMFLHAQTPHAYLSGTALEIMANSDNVLRAGLTKKHIDTKELINNLSVKPTQASRLIMSPIEKPFRLTYPIPVDDFCFDIVLSTAEQQVFYIRSAEVLFCIEGQILIETEQHSVRLEKGESAFITCDCHSYHISGVGKLARAYN
ncbi:mannose-6-phosphate isomerase, class I [Vibrio sp. OCN044]|uniref:mannose-6-phosphate isomerase n=1 Tax=Vibrio tetraodonis subsp. pristinus TaxID=2695891 RepID=A0A6L8LY92_9VIBR|nr:mannose-6-phosphate isomerase, class I [Vibrio tetraodonis]MYM58172.1 mannose-6-phosphate isomerase, class I [Vibrio tetraodonis subsp. pristinus]